MIKRKLFDELVKHLSKKEISFIVGPRQAGKTTLMLMLKDYLEKRDERVLFLNLDIEQDKEYFTSQRKLINKVELELGKQGGHVFIDEIQRKEDAGLFLKGIYDMGLPYKFVVSGSGSVELKEKVHESLVGRKRVFELSTLSFMEFVHFRTGYQYEDRITDFFSVEGEKVEDLVNEYLGFGGYPRVVLESELAEKQKLINEIYQSYIERDIAYLLKVHKTEAFSNLVKILAAQSGKIVNFSELSSTLGIASPTLKEYVWYLEKTFIVQRVSPFFRNIRKEITKAPTFYFYDLGLRNFALGQFGSHFDKGFVFQNFIFRLLKEEVEGSAAKIGFWRTKDKAEVDFVVDFGAFQLPIEVKYRLSKPGMTRALRGFIERYEPKKAIIVNMSLDATINLGSTKVRMMPFYRLSLDSILK